MYAKFAGKAPQTLLYLQWATKLWYTRAAMAPFAVWLALRFTLRRDRWLRYLLLYFVGSFVLALMASTLQSVAVTRIGTARFFYPSEMSSETSAPGAVHLTKFQNAVVKGWPHLIYNMFTCWMLIGLVQGAVYYDEARRQQVQALELEAQLALESLRALRMQLNPHFLFNTLHSISTLIEDEPKVAEEMILRLSHLLRSILDENKPEISLREELCFLEDHLAIEKVRFGERLKTVVMIEDPLLDCAVPQLILQPLVENVIQHGIGRHAGSDSIEISASSRSDLLHIEVKNYNSLLEGSMQPSSRVGIGRLKTLYKDRCSIDLQPLSPSGFSVCLSVPLRMMPQVEVGAERVLTS
jgi:signal transduction histidine kinase